MNVNRCIETSPSHLLHAAEDVPRQAQVPHRFHQVSLRHRRAALGEATRQSCRVSAHARVRAGHKPVKRHHFLQKDQMSYLN